MILKICQKYIFFTREFYMHNLTDIKLYFMKTMSRSLWSTGKEKDLGC